MSWVKEWKKFRLRQGLVTVARVAGGDLVIRWSYWVGDQVFNAKSGRSNVTGLLFVVNTVQAAVLGCSFNKAVTI